MIILASAWLVLFIFDHASSFTTSPGLTSIAPTKSRPKQPSIVLSSKEGDETPPPAAAAGEEEIVVPPPPAVEKPPPTAVAASSSSELPGGISMPDMPDMDFSSVTELVQDIDLDEFAVSAQAGLSNLISTDNIGQRGELYTVGQFALIGAVLFGGIPVVGDLLFLLLGPATMLAGLGLTVGSVGNMGNALSPWPTPASDGQLVTTGLYEKMRHPMYTGLVCTLLGYSILLSSAPRLMLTGVLWAFLNVKAEQEEKYLLETYPEYEAYKVCKRQRLLLQQCCEYDNHGDQSSNFSPAIWFWFRFTFYKLTGQS